MESSEKKVVILLWSGGWDGTFRFMQLLQYDIIIQPIYISSPERESIEYEKRAIASILEKVRGRYKAEVLDVQYYDRDWILNECKNEKISRSFEILREKYKVGTQYEWFALLTDHFGIQMEAAVVHQYHGKVEWSIEGEGILERIPDDFLPDRYHVLPKGENTTAYDVFGNLILPVIKLTKKDEETIARENGWIEIMELTWFCHSPIDGKPCGTCNPCKDAMNTGMEWRMPKESQKRYHDDIRQKKIRKLSRKFKINKVLQKIKGKS